MLLYSDNTQVLAMVSTGRSCNVQAMGLLRELFWCCSVYNIDLCALYIPTNENICANALSRLPISIKNVSTYGLPYMFQCC